MSIRLDYIIYLIRSIIIDFEIFYITSVITQILFYFSQQEHMTELHELWSQHQTGQWLDVYFSVALRRSRDPDPNEILVPVRFGSKGNIISIRFEQFFSVQRVLFGPFLIYGRKMRKTEFSDVILNNSYLHELHWWNK